MKNSKRTRSRYGFEDTFMSTGRSLFERGYSVAMADPPGQGTKMVDGRLWEIEAENR